MLSVFLIVSWVRRRQRYAGQAFLTMVGTYALGRFVLEFARGDLERGFHFGGSLSTGQVTSLTLVAFAVTFHLIRSRTSTPS